MNIYQATLHDIEGIAELFDLYRSFYRQPSDKKAAKAFIEERFAKNDSVIFVAKDGDTYAGFTQLYPLWSSVSMKRLWILNDLYVAAESRNKGVGKQLLDAAKQLAKETQAKGLKLQTEINNVTAQRLYESDGWVKDDQYFYYVVSNE